MSTYITPHVASEARRLGVDPQAVTGTGAGGRVSLKDVQAAAATRHNVPRAINVTSGHRLDMEVASSFSRQQFQPVTIDVFGANPLLQDLRAARTPEELAAYQRAGGPPPCMFEAGDLPLFLASGQSTSLILALPWVARHAAARADGAQLTSILEEFGCTNPSTEGRRTEAYFSAMSRFEDDLGNATYLRRMNSWADDAAVNAAFWASTNAQNSRTDRSTMVAPWDATARTDFNASAGAEVEARQRRSERSW